MHWLLRIALEVLDTPEPKVCCGCRGAAAEDHLIGWAPLSLDLHVTERATLGLISGKVIEAGGWCADASARIPVHEPTHGWGAIERWF